ncbi:hypothetical protein [Lichenifustis flavocetrariae]|uniref:Uncharacterized protein n=1 Tax=Lichenifustis flavocetrariae TaxID=2949735 RepID=A0AA41Z4P2_9HYPH|nr:hypothetical protein [Lichenifustis flavocetrariae]MCW6513012.1 hypothetical protein [Lichenifustis flavocetrariae]
MQLSLNFLPTPRPASPSARLAPEQRAALVDAMARILAKAAGPAEALAEDRTAVTSRVPMRKGHNHD